MIIQNDCKIEFAASPDKEALSEPYFTGKEVVATDGNILAVIPVDGGQNDTPGYISGSFLKRLRAGTTSCGNAVYLSANGDLEGQHRKEGLLKAERPLKDCEFPKWQNVVPGERRESVLALDPGLLFRLARAIGYEGSVKLHLPLDGKGNLITFEAIRVTNNKGEGNQRNYGVIMPCRCKQGS